MGSELGSLVVTVECQGRIADAASGYAGVIVAAMTVCGGDDGMVSESFRHTR